MPTQLIQQGVATDILQNVVYALPARRCFVQAPVALEAAMTPAFATVQAITAAGLSTVLPFVRCTVGNTTIIAKADG